MFSKSKISAYIHLIRIKQWIKNGFIFFPLFFDLQFSFNENLLKAIFAFFAFSFIASSLYCFNDLIDLDFDKNHEEKKDRPLPSGMLKPSSAIICAIFLALIAFLVSAFLVSYSLVFVLLAYFLLNVLYSLILKKVIFLDILCIAFSFVLRIIAGGVATNTYLSYWILLLVFLLALFLALGKRREELLIFLNTKKVTRKNINLYSLKYIDYGISILIFSISIIYLLYSLSPETILQFDSNKIFLTFPFVLIGLLRYRRLLKKRKFYANSTNVIFKDFFIQIIVVGWILLFYFLIY